MSYNVSSVKILLLDARMRAGDILKFVDHEDLPEDCFLHNLVKEACNAPNRRSKIPLKDLAWQGEGSGHSRDLFSKIAKCIIGNAEGIMIWEGGNSFTGFRIVDGKYTQHSVIMSLGAEV